jgi:uncharacterized SAM-binding protein YcdF (DUF218 family)
VAISVVLMKLHYRRISLILQGLTLLLFLMITTGVIPFYLLQNLQKPYEEKTSVTWKNANAIILLGSGTIKIAENNIQPTIFSYGRIYETAQLYFSCKQSSEHCLIFVSGGDALKTGASEALIYREALIKLRIPSTDIVIEPNSMNTFANAKFTSELLKDRQFDQVILVTSAFHLKRSLLYFSHFNVHPEPIAADFITTTKFHLPRSSDFLMTDIALHENIGILRFYVYNFLNLNKK